MLHFFYSADQEDQNDATRGYRTCYVAQEALIPYTHISKSDALPAPDAVEVGRFTQRQELSVEVIDRDKALKSLARLRLDHRIRSLVETIPSKPKPAEIGNMNVMHD